eukprot:gene33500-56134_t
MDISKASNFERFVFDLLGRDGARVKALFGEALSRDGNFTLGADPAFADAAARYGFRSGKSTHENRLDTIRGVFQRHGVMIDTHTADGVKVAREHLQAGVPMIVLETALPIKFAETIVEALGQQPHRPPQFEGIEDLPKRVRVMPASPAAVQAYVAEVVGFAGFSGSGKTTLVEQLIPALKLRGQRVSVVKHAHHSFDIDHPGKDTWRHREAGAFEVL